MNAGPTSKSRVTELVAMPIYDAQSIPGKVHSGTKDPEIAEWLKTGPVLGAHKPIHIQRREHDAFIDEVKPPIGQIEHLGLRGPHGTIPVRVYHPLKPGPAKGSAIIYSICTGADSLSVPWISSKLQCVSSLRAAAPKCTA
jgi:hypothetical protein